MQAEGVVGQYEPRVDMLARGDDGGVVCRRYTVAVPYMIDHAIAEPDGRIIDHRSVSHMHGTAFQQDGLRLSGCRCRLLRLNGDGQEQW